METPASMEENSTKSVENVIPENNVKEQTPTAALPEPQKKSRKEERNKKDEKALEQFMKSLNSLAPEEKFSTVCKKYTQTLDENKKLQFYIKQSDKRYATQTKEKEQLQLEYNKMILVKSKLENLCRELQKQNKAIKEESLLKIREEEERRKETQAKFQSTLSEITTLLHQNNDKNAKLRDDNINMTEKFKSVVQQYQLREQQVDKMSKQMALESQLSDAKLQKAKLEHQAEKERLMAEMETFRVTVAQYRAKIVELQGTETALKGQLTLYQDKYDEFQNALVKSSQVFGGFKEQMEMMSKKIKKLEKESLSWKNRWETSQTALLDMCSERQANEERAAASARQLHHMQSLCRTLQSERTVLLNTLKENNIERPPVPVTPLPQPPPPAPASNAKVDAMAANCAELRQSLAHLQSQLNVLTTKKEEPQKQEKQKKSKSKKNKGERSQKAEQKSEVKETESDESPAKETEPSANDVTVANDASKEEETSIDVKDDKVDDALKSLIEAIDNTNINVFSTEVVISEKDKTEEKVKEVLESTEVETNDREETKVTESDRNGVTDKSNEVNTEKSKEVNTEISKEVNIEKSKEVITEKSKEVITEKSTEVTSNGAEILNVSQEVNSNDEISHIPEVKPISDGA